MSHRIGTSHVVVATLLIFIVAACCPAQESLVSNGDFDRWQDGAPQGWKVEVGARNGAESPVSEVKRIVGPALMMRGDEATMAWRSVSQDVDVRAGSRYRLVFEARSKEVRRQGRQYDNCYVGWMSLDAGGKLVGRELADVSTGTSDWKRFELDYTVPAKASSTAVTVFLSKSGLIAVKKVEVTPAPPANDLISNGSFRSWTSGRPDGWKVETGANNGGDTPLSKVSKLAEQGVSLSGNAKTLAWRSLSQQVDVSEGKAYTLRFEAQAIGVQRQGRQYDNCYLGVMSFDARGKRLDMVVEDLSGERTWKEFELKFVPPASSAKTDVLIFLSKSGTLNLRNLRLEEASSDRPFR